MPRRQFSVDFKLKVLEYSNTHSGEETAKHFKIDPKSVRLWKKQRADLDQLSKSGGKKRKILDGGGRKPICQDFENDIFDWVVSERKKKNRITRKMIMQQALTLYQESGNDKPFKASRFWVHKMMKRTGLSLRRGTTTAQKDPEDLFPKLVSFIVHISQLKDKYDLKDQDIIGMDETSLWFDMLGNTTVEQKGAKEVCLKSTGNEKTHFTVVLAAKADGTKLKPMIIFKGAIRKVKELQNKRGIVVKTSKNGWMNTDLTVQWIDDVYGKLNFSKRMIIWDSYRCHIDPQVKNHLKEFNSLMCVVPGGCTKYVQPPDLSWNKPFKQHVRDSYDAWMAGDKNKEYTSGGNLKGPPIELLTDWVKLAWESLSPEMIKMSFKYSGITTLNDGSEDGLIHCFKEGQQCEKGRELLQKFRDEVGRNEITPVVEEDQEQMDLNEAIISNSEESDADSTFQTDSSD